MNTIASRPAGVAISLNDTLENFSHFFGNALTRNSLKAGKLIRLAIQIFNHGNANNSTSSAKNSTRLSTTAFVNSARFKQPPPQDDTARTQPVVRRVQYAPLQS